MATTFGQAAPIDGREIPRTLLWIVWRPHGCSGRGCSFTWDPPSVGLPMEVPLVGNWPRVKHLIEGWSLPQNWGMVETLEAVALAFHEIEDSLEALSGLVAAAVVKSIFLEIVESVIKERERDFDRRETHFSITWRVMTYGMPLRKRDSY